MLNDIECKIINHTLFNIGTTNYYNLHLPEEINKYIFRILAFKYLLENADEVGFQVKTEDKYIAVPFRDFYVNTTIPDLAIFAQKQGTSYKILRAMNPWIRGRVLDVKNGKNYKIRLPE